MKKVRKILVLYVFFVYLQIILCKISIVMRKLQYLLIGLLFLCVGFEQINAQPVMTMTSATATSYSSADFAADYTSTGGWTVAKKGFIYGTNPVPTKANGATLKQKTGSTVAAFTSSVTGLAPNTTYYVRTYATKTGPADTVYSSNILSFTTPPAVPPTMTTPTASDITLFTATLNSTITDKGDASSFTSKGFIYSTTPGVTYSTGTKVTVSGTVNASSIPFPMTKVVEGLVAGVTYYAKAFAIIKYGTAVTDTIYTDEMSFTTAHACQSVPTNVTISEIGITEAKVDFQPGVGQTQWQIKCGIIGQSDDEAAMYVTNDTTYVVTDLEGGRSYSVYVRAVCGSLFSEWSEIRNFVTLPPLCANVSGVRTTEVQHSSVKITWNPGSMSQNMWEVVFAQSNQSLPASGIVIQDNPIFTPIGLTPQTEYKMKVRAVCDGGEVSSWSDEFVFNTIQQGIEDAQSVENIDIYPIPTDGKIVFNANNLRVEKIEILNLLGEVVYFSEKLPKEFDFEEKKGIFFVNIYTEKGVQTRKVVVK